MRNADRSTPVTRRILDVGCGQNKFPGAIGIDANPRSHADVIHDLGVIPYPFADDEFDEIICRHVIEHVPDVLGFITELHRITRPGGRLKIVTPRSEEHTSELQSQSNLVCRLLLEKKKKKKIQI